MSKRMGDSWTVVILKEAESAFGFSKPTGLAVHRFNGVGRVNGGDLDIRHGWGR